MQRSISYLAIFGLVVICLTGIILTSAQDLSMSVDGLRCDSCGSECSRMCGQRQFRTCCFNYIKKRSDPLLARVSGSQSKHGRRSISEELPLSQDAAALAYVLPGPQIYFSSVQDREPTVYHDLSFAQSRRPSVDI